MSVEFPMELQLKMVGLFDEGKSAGEIGRELNLQTTSITRVLKRHRRKMRVCKMETHPFWKGGRVIKMGYWCVRIPNHPYVNNNGYVKEHRVIVEKEIGRYLTRDENIHHIDFDRMNNERSNLWLCSVTEHKKAERSIQKLVKNLLKNGIVRFNRDLKIYELTTESISKQTEHNRPKVQQRTSEEKNELKAKIKEAINNNVSLLKLAKQLNVPRSTILYYARRLL